MGRVGPSHDPGPDRRQTKRLSIRRRNEYWESGIVGVGAGELIAEGVLAVEMAALAKDMALTIHPHPTLTETLMESAEVFFGTSTDIYRPKKS